MAKGRPLQRWGESAGPLEPLCEDLSIEQLEARYGSRRWRPTSKSATMFGCASCAAASASSVETLAFEGSSVLTSFSATRRSSHASPASARLRANPHWGEAGRAVNVHRGGRPSPRLLGFQLPVSVLRQRVSVAAGLDVMTNGEPESQVHRELRGALGTAVPCSR